MAVRRLAEVQPDSFAFTAENVAWAEKEIAKYPEGRQASTVISLLWRAQEQEGWVSEPAITTIAEMLDMPRIRVLEVATFYTMFHLEPVGTVAHIQVCGTTPCWLRGADAIKDVCRSRIHAEQHHLSADGSFSWEEVECLGACVNAPLVQVNADTYEDLTAESFGKLLDDFAAGREVKPGPQIDRQYAAPEGGPTSLTDVPKAAPGSAAPAAVAAAAVAEAPAEPAGEGVQPAGLEGPRDGKADNLKLISGVGPKLEGVLNGLGIFHFDQVAAWTPEEVAWVDEHLKFKGRIAREDWIAQATTLAAGGETDFSSRQKGGGDS